MFAPCVRRNSSEIEGWIVSESKLTLIVPFYNSEATLARCLSSIEHQSIDSIDVILVDDGSTDKSLEIAERYKENSRWKVSLVSKSNGGPSSARNIALKMAKSEYVAFADADDEMCSSMYEKLCANADLHHSDIVSCGRLYRDSASGKEVRRVVPQYDVLRGGVRKNPQIVKRVGPLMCDKLFRLSLINSHNIQFDESLQRAEDFLFVSTVKVYSNVVSAVSEPLYCYTINNAESLSGGDEHIVDVLYSCQAVIDLYARKGVLSQVKPFLLYTLVGYFLRRAMLTKRSNSQINGFVYSFAQMLDGYFPRNWRGIYLNRLMKYIPRYGITAGFRGLMALLLCKSKGSVSSSISSHSKQFVFSVVIPVYNAMPYLPETLDSVLNQTVGYRCIQVILVDDGSTDDSPLVCKRYVSRYPDNVVYVRQENRGVSAARNAGLQLISGQIVNFLDSDDKWSADAFEKAKCMFDSHPDLNVVSAKMLFFDGKSGGHPLNYKFKVDRVVDIKRQYDFPQLSLPSSFVRAESLKGLQFDTRLSISEDTVFVNQLIMSSGCYGALSDPIYWYRKRREGGSAIDSSTHSMSYYFDTPKYCYAYLLEIADSYEAGRYGQYLVMYDLQWRFLLKDDGFLQEDEKRSYIESIRQLLQKIHDEVILEQRNLTNEYKLHVLSVKYGIPGSGNAFDSKLLTQSVKDWLSLSRYHICVDFIELSDQNALRIEGELFRYFPDDEVSVCAVVVRSDGEISYVLPSMTTHRVHSCKDSFFAKSFFCPLAFQLDVSLVGGIKEFRIALIANGELIDPASYYVTHRKFSKVSNKLKYSAFDLGAYCVSGGGSRMEISKRCSLRARAVHAKHYLGMLGLNSSSRRGLLFVLAAKMLKAFVSRDIWLISDRVMTAGDNGQALFEYLCACECPNNVVPIFAVSRRSASFRDLKKQGKVVNHGSVLYKSILLASTKIVSSAAEDAVFEPFGKNRDIMKSFIASDFVFLQHGITKDDQSRWLNRYNKNIKLLICAGVPEYWSFLTNRAYYYDSNVVKLTGFPRHDKLLRSLPPIERIILVMPTWRRGLVGKYDPSTGKVERSACFEGSDFYLRYKSMLCNETLKCSLRDRGYVIYFALHPSMMQERECFLPFEDDVIRVLESPVDYTDLFRRSSALVTDFSSVAFDFALLRKPILYYQFDSESFFSGQVYDKGYFDYERDGFGPILHKEEELVMGICDAMIENCKIKKEFESRIDNFFFDEGGSRCEKVVNYINMCGRDD